MAAADGRAPLSSVCASQSLRLASRAAVVHKHQRRRHDAKEDDQADAQYDEQVVDVAGLAETHMHLQKREQQSCEHTRAPISCKRQLQIRQTEGSKAIRN